MTRELKLTGRQLADRMQSKRKVLRRFLVYRTEFVPMISDMVGEVGEAVVLSDGRCIFLSSTNFQLNIYNSVQDAEWHLGFYGACEFHDLDADSREDQ